MSQSSTLSATTMEEVAATFSYSCSMEANPKSSFGWSDFPIIGDGANLGQRLASSYYKQSMWEEPVKEQQFDCASDTSSTTSLESFSEDDDSLDGCSSTPASSSAGLTTSIAAQSQSPPKKVRFGHILSIRTHEVTLGDHPFCSGGMALECGWRHSGTELLDLDTYEDIHGPTRRRMGDLRLHYGQRRARLQSLMRLSGAQLLRLEYELMCLDQQQQERDERRRQREQQQQQETAVDSSSWRPLHHAGSVSNALDQQWQPRQTRRQASV